MQVTRESGSKIPSLVWELMPGEMVVSIRATGPIIIWMAWEYTNGQRAESMKESLKTTRNMVMDSTPGQMVETSGVGGTRESSTDWESTRTRIMEKLSMDCGRWEKE